MCLAFLYSLSFINTVPIPWSVKNSRSKACGMRPSRIWTRFTPFSTAFVQPESFGSMPPPIVPELIRSFAAVTVSLDMKVEGSFISL